MKYWERYIGKQKREYLQTKFPTDVNADIIVVIPCYDEPDLSVTLQSLLDCEIPETNVLVSIVFNSGVLSDEDAVRRNRLSYEKTALFAEKHFTSHLCFLPLLFENLPRKHAGVGLARKIGMDLSVEYFLKAENPRGIIGSLDADCMVSENYFTGIYRAFEEDPRLCGTVHNFLHRVENNDPVMENAARQYEAYIRYFRDMLKFTGFPYHYHTIGSAFAVSADAYVRAGGMGRQQGGEDFYFLQKIFALGPVKELDNVYVYPMARFSSRVPFGTGPALQKIIDEPDGRMKVYSRQSFGELKRFFDLKDTFFRQDKNIIETSIQNLHPSLVRFIMDTDFMDAIEDCNKNCATPASFRKRFFHHFNAFRIIKYLNYAHPDPFLFEEVPFVVDKHSFFLG